MENDRKLMQFYFLTSPEKATHYHQNLEIIYILRGEMGIQIDDAYYVLKNGDFIVVNANKSHTITVTREMFGARFEIDFHLLAECMGTMQLMFWCNTAADKNDAYEDVRVLLDRILERYFEKEDKGSLHLQSLYYETLHLLTSNFMVKADDVRINLENSQDRVRVRQIQNYIQANYQGQISLNDLAEKLYLSNAYLSKYVKKHLGLTFLEYLNNVRLFHAGSVFEKLGHLPEATQGNMFGAWDPKTFEVEDSAFGYIKMKNGATIFLEAAWAINMKDSREAATTLCGTKAGAEIIGGMSKEGGYDLVINKTSHGQLTEERLSPGGTIAFFEGGSDKEEVVECKQWMEAILNDTEPLVKPEQAFVVTKILDNIYKANQLGHEIKF